MITLRPCLVLTNASKVDLELQCFEEGRLLRLASGQSIEAHWSQTNEARPPTVRFRPLPVE
ncbi:unnamed protein product, partial [Durusdinium trenchii]